MIFLTNLFFQLSYMVAKSGEWITFITLMYFTGNFSKEFLNWINVLLIVYCMVKWADSLNSIIQRRIINFWCRIVCGKKSKYSSILYNLTRKMHDDTSNPFNSKWISNVKNILDYSGLGHFWINQNNMIPNGVKHTIDQRLHDIDKQNWFSEMQNNSCCTNYRIFKTELTFENYLIKLILVIE